ncbi:MAG TPA: response regulator [Treponema sp.]|nr:response regulator [Treponema sp.]
MPDSLLLGSILDITADFICVLSDNGTIIAINEGFARLVNGKSRDTLNGLIAAQAVQGSSELKEFLSSIQSKPDGSYLQSIHRNGEKPVSIKFNKVVVITPNSGNYTYLSGCDVTSLIEEKACYEKQIQRNTNFIVRMGHEFKTPINTVLGYAQLLSGLDNLPVSAQSYISTIIMQENNLLHLLNNMLEYSKFEAGQTSLVTTETNLHKLVEDVTRSYLEEFSRKLLSLTVDYKTEVPEAIISDPGKIIQVLSNLLGNALKYTRKGGVSVTVSCDEQIIFDIEDTGIGIPDDEKEGVFDVYTNSDVGEDYTANVGIGLVVARIFARMMGGDVVLIRSSCDNGSLFRATFDMIPVKNSKIKTQKITNYSSIKGISRPCKVLLVDDVDINLAMLEIFLAPAGFDISTAANGNEAIQMFNQEKPDIVFMDLIMPKMDGFEATRKIKSLAPDIPVIALTASIVDSVKFQALEAGVNDFMYKPFIPERFFEIISQYTGIEYSIE